MFKPRFSLLTLLLACAYYVEPVDSEKLFDGATTGMVKALGDPYSAYLDKKSFSEITDLTDGVFGGIGVVLGKKDNDFVVIAPMEGTPGDEAGIKAGDKILAVDGTSVDGMQLEDVVGKIRGKQGTGRCRQNPRQAGHGSGTETGGRKRQRAHGARYPRRYKS